MPSPAPRLVPPALIAASAAILLAALGFQYLGGLQPCVLCIWQRWPYVAAILLAAGAAALHRRPAGRLLLGLAGLAFLVGAGLAAFHAGVELHWWAGTAECGADAAPAASVEELKRRLLAQPVVRCDEIAWSFLGLSMAGWNLLLSLGLAGLSFWGAFARETSDVR